MRKIIILGGMLVVTAGVIALAFGTHKQLAAQHLTGPPAAKLVDPTMLRLHLQKMREEMALP
jgi:hypothetical protein